MLIWLLDKSESESVAGECVGEGGWAVAAAVAAADDAGPRGRRPQAIVFRRSVSSSGPSGLSDLATNSLALAWRGDGKKSAADRSGRNSRNAMEAPPSSRAPLTLLPPFPFLSMLLASSM